MISHFINYTRQNKHKLQNEDSSYFQNPINSFMIKNDITFSEFNYGISYKCVIVGFGKSTIKLYVDEHNWFFIMC